MLGLQNGKYGVWVASMGMLASSLACGGGFDDTSSDAEGYATDSEDGSMAAQSSEGAEGDDVELGQTQQALSWRPSFTSSCHDPTGTDSVLAAIAVATAKELRRWQPLVDFKVVNSMVVLTEIGKARCADGQCYNTQALLDLQKDAANKVEIRPGVRLSPKELRERLENNYNKQKMCNLLGSFWGCKAPDHEFKFLQAEPGACDMNYWFEVRTPLGALLSRAGLDDLKDKLVWLDENDNSYIKFQTNGNNVAIDPTYGLNETATTAVGSCSAACTKISNGDVSGRCCSCNGTKKYARSVWSAATYICQ
jgi:hypothetical protein